MEDAKAMAIREGSACTVHIGNDLVLTGYVDDFTPSYDAKEVSWVVSGRSKTSDLDAWPSTRAVNGKRHPRQGGP